MKDKVLAALCFLVHHNEFYKALDLLGLAPDPFQLCEGEPVICDQIGFNSVLPHS